MGAEDIRWQQRLAAAAGESEAAAHATRGRPRCPSAGAEGGALRDRIAIQHPGPGHGLSERTLTEIRECLAAFADLRWTKLYGSRALGRHRPGSDIDLAFSAPEDCSAALLAALEDLPTPYRFDLTHWESLRHRGLRERIERVGVPFP